MNKKIFLLIFIICSTFSGEIYANWYQDIINAINAQGLISNGFLSSINSQQAGILQSQREVEKAMRQVESHMTGNSGWGTYQFHDYQSYGEGAQTWAQVMQMAQQGQGDGALGQTMGGISNQFPADRYLYSKGVRDVNSQKYYALKSQTILAARAASQLDYNKIQDQIAYQQMLQQQIEKTKDIKAAMDLSSRIQVEGNLINLEILRQASLSNQQQAITEQGSINAALSNAKFLTKE